MVTSHSVITALPCFLKQCELKVSTKTLECFVKEIDPITPWYACSGSLTLASWDKLRGDLARERQNGKLKAGTVPLWKLIKSCLEDEKCRLAVKAGQGVLEEVQDSMSETEWGKRLGAQRKKGIPKKQGPSKDSGSEEEREKGKGALERKGRRERERGGEIKEKGKEREMEKGKERNMEKGKENGRRKGRKKERKKGKEGKKERKERKEIKD
jgi:protein O-GlcNAc transferase